jgi:hypothetical protein
MVKLLLRQIHKINGANWDILHPCPTSEEITVVQWLYNGCTTNATEGHCKRSQRNEPSGWLCTALANAVEVSQRRTRNNRIESLHSIYVSVSQRTHRSSHFDINFCTYPSSIMLGGWRRTVLSRSTAAVSNVTPRFSVPGSLALLRLVVSL